jgi:hypothetical protein
MFTAVMNPISNFQVASSFIVKNASSATQARATSAVSVWEFPNEAELADELLAALSSPLPVMVSPEIAPEDFERFAQEFLS